MLFARNKEIRGINMDGSQSGFNVIPALSPPHVFRPVTIDYDIQGGRLYWVDADKYHGQPRIQSANLQGKDVQTIIDSGKWWRDYY